jgi:hypothetical protein
MGSERWMSLFEQKSKQITHGNDSRGFLYNLNQILQDPLFSQSEDGFWARSFLVSCLARNLTAHIYPTDDWFYGDLFGEMAHAIVYSVFYSWHVAKREHWV